MWFSMKGDPRNPADWHRIARIDLARARRAATDDDPSACAFWLEQAVEKALKGWLIEQGWALVKTHDLKRLVAETATRGLDLSAYESPLQRLNRLYLTDRYVEDSDDPEPDDAEAATLSDTAERIVDLLFPPGE